MRPGKYTQLKENDPLDALIDKLDRVKASIKVTDGISITNEQATVRARQEALPWAQKKHGPTLYTICTVQPEGSAEQTI
jgi:hypothetical protein